MSWREGVHWMWSLERQNGVSVCRLQIYKPWLWVCRLYAVLCEANGGATEGLESWLKGLLWQRKPMHSCLVGGTGYFCLGCQRECRWHSRALNQEKRSRSNIRDMVLKAEVAVQGDAKEFDVMSNVNHRIRCLERPVLFKSLKSSKSTDADGVESQAVPLWRNQ